MSDVARLSPSPWLLFGTSLVASFLVPVILVSVWAGKLETRAETIEDRQTRTEARVEAVVTQQAAASREAGELKVELQGVGREMTRLANAVERLANSPK